MTLTAIGALKSLIPITFKRFSSSLVLKIYDRIENCCNRIDFKEKRNLKIKQISFTPGSYTDGRSWKMNII